MHICNHTVPPLPQIDDHHLFVQSLPPRTATSLHTIATTTKYNHNHHHHTVPVAMCSYSSVCTLVNALVLQGKTPPSCTVSKTILGTSMEAGCSDQMQLAQGHLNADLALVHLHLVLHPNHIQCKLQYTMVI